MVHLQRYLSLALSFFLFLLIGLQATVTQATMRADLDDFSEVKVEMRKPEVLGIMGDPNISRRDGRSDEDVWVYWFFNEKDGVVSRFEKEIRIKNGKVSYTGDPKPTQKLSAEEQDAVNMKLVQQDLDAYKAQQDRAKESREDYKKWQEKVKYGEEGSRVPKFYPVK